MNKPKNALKLMKIFSRLSKMLLKELKKSLLTSLPLNLLLKKLRKRLRPQSSLFQEVKTLKKRRKKS
jgi:hypothetical protein